VKGGLEKLVQKGRITADNRDGMLRSIIGTVALADLGACDLMIEAVFEDMQVKKDLFKALDGICKKETVFATNTSSLSVSEMAASTSRAGQFVGMHFFNPHGNASGRDNWHRLHPARARAGGHDIRRISWEGTGDSERQRGFYRDLNFSGSTDPRLPSN
jgi:hypothetical protein